MWEPDNVMGAYFEYMRPGGHVGWSEQLVDRLISWPVGKSEAKPRGDTCARGHALARGDMLAS